MKIHINFCGSYAIMSKSGDFALKNELMLPIYLFSDLYESLPKMLDFFSDLTEKKNRTKF